ncbi:RNA polymerase subunit sigma-24 [Brachybacterium phenoliresistens]|uniref:RNA polymerase subunit sigma-24 n=1 Tax=Brachybacterium phenoliresistens TaxID=396014 RepID=Z9JVX5_9MICO|nr:sigma-70 family RNA polymerase sigma factor [Brachybacterium phenoliresistens]EWS82359.1 RNA polymerase subunit sigma-24 [Brachybacterium phenoliresistens]
MSGPGARRPGTPGSGGSPRGAAAAARDAEVAAAVAAAHREHWGSVLAATAGLTRDLDLAEDCVQEAFVQALSAWREDGVPGSPGGWLATTARRRALDALRRGETLRRKLPLLVWDETAPSAETEGDAEAQRDAPAEGDAARPARIADEERAVVRDEQLRLIFLAAHPALAPEARVALTLRLVGGLTTAQIAAAFLVGETAMAARLTRAKKRIVLSRIPCRVPGAGEIDARLVDVLDVVSVLLATGERAGGEDVLDAAVRILEVLAALRPRHPEVQGLLAQALLLKARAATRHDARGRPVALALQDRGAWDRGLVQRADALVIEALAGGGRGPYLLQGAIAAAVAVPARHEDVDWEEVVALYDALLGHWPTAIVRLGRIVALGEARGAAAALAQLETLGAELDEHRPFHVIRAELLGRIGAHEQAAEALRTALERRGPEGESALLRELVRGV